MVVSMVVFIGLASVGQVVSMVVIIGLVILLVG